MELSQSTSNLCLGPCYEHDLLPGTTWRHESPALLIANLQRGPFLALGSGAYKQEPNERNIESDTPGRQWLYHGRESHCPLK